MRTEAVVRFEDGDLDVIAAVQPVAQLIPSVTDDPRSQLDRYVRRAADGDAFDFEALARFSDLLDELLVILRRQTTAGWWREQGATGADDAVEGLAATRRRQVADLEAAKGLVATACFRIGAAMAPEHMREAS